MAALATLAAGVTFACSAAGGDVLEAPGSFSVFKPAGRTFEGYRVSGPDHSYFNPAELELVEDELPALLRITWRRELNSPVTLAIMEHDEAAGTARFAVSTERNPASALYTPLSFEGSCTSKSEESA